MNEEIPEIGTGKKGRPTTLESLDIDKVIQDCFNMGLSPAYVIQQTGLNKNTVYAKYKELEQTIKEEQTTDFIERHEMRKAQYILTIDDLISRVYNVLNQVEKRIRSYEEKDLDIPVFLLQKFTDLTKNLFDLQQKKAAQAMGRPPMP